MIEKPNAGAILYLMGSKVPMVVTGADKTTVWVTWLSRDFEQQKAAFPSECVSFEPAKLPWDEL